MEIESLDDCHSEITIWRIQLPRLADGHGRLLFPCDGYGFLCEGKNTIIYDGLGRRLGSITDLKHYIEDRGCTGEEQPEDNYEAVCQISYEEMQEAKKINLELEKYSKRYL